MVEQSSGGKKEYTGVHRLQRVPFLHSKHANWCNYADLSMQLRFLDPERYAEFTPEAIFEHFHPEEKYDPEKERAQDKLNLPRSMQRKHPTFSRLGLAAQKLTKGEVKASLYHTKKYALADELYRRTHPNSELTPFDIYHKTIVERGLPPLIRIPSHSILGVGVDFEKDTYTFHDPMPSRTKPRVMTKADFVSLWGSEEAEYHPDYSTKNLMLVLAKVKKGNPTILC
jgi:hypothetical protein